MGILESLIASMLPILIQEAESLLGQPKPSDNSWIVGLVQEVASLIENKLPGFLAPSLSEVEVLVEEAISKLMAKI